MSLAGRGSASMVLGGLPKAALHRHHSLTEQPGGGFVDVELPGDGAAAELATRPSVRSAEPRAVPTWLRFGFGTLSAMGATFFTHPVDVVKYAIQLNTGKAGQPTNSVAQARQIVATSGASGLYKGIGASMMRQASYGTTRLGIYTTLLDAFTVDNKPPPLWQKLAFSVAAGGIGGFVGNPFDLALVRMAADSTLPPAERRNYKGVFDAVARIVRTEGFTKLWIGAGPTVSRCVVLNMAQLTTYTQAKEELLKTGLLKDNIWCHLSASMISGFIATVASTPFDVAKTRVQYDRTKQYAGMADCLLKTTRNEGVLSLWKGFGPAYGRLAPQTVLVFIFLEKLQHTYQSA